VRIIDVAQGSEEWDGWRNRPTASEFGKFCTPAKGDWSQKQGVTYAAKIVSKRLGVYVEPPPSFDMDRGTDLEDSAKLAYEKAGGCKIVNVGFVLPDHTDAYGGSPDGLVGDDGLIEIKVPRAETLIAYHAAGDGELPLQYKPQVQALLMITGRAWCDFYVWHPELTPFLIRVLPDEKYQTKQAQCLLRLLGEIERIEAKVSKMQHEIVGFTTADIVTDFGERTDG